MATKEEREARNTRIEKMKDQTNLIAENASHTDYVDDKVLSGKVFDVYDILNVSTNPVVVKLRKLADYGITDEMIADIYGGLTSNVETKESALDTLSSIYKNLVRYINKLPNGIVIDPKTGEKHEEASRRQAARVGITDDKYYYKLQKIGEKKLKEEIKGIIRKDINEEVNISKFNEYRSIVINNSGNEINFDEIMRELQERRKQECKEIIFARKIDETFEIVRNLIENELRDLRKHPLEERIKLAPNLITTLRIDNKNVEQKQEAYKFLKELFPDLSDADGRNSNVLTARIATEILGKEIDANDINQLFDAIEEIQKQQFEKLDKESDEEARYEIEVSDPVLAIEAALESLDKSSPEYNIFIGNLGEFYKNNPNCELFSKTLRDENGNFSIGAQCKISEYKTSLMETQINSKIKQFKNLDKANLTQEEKQHYASIFLIGAEHKDDIDLAKQAEELLKEVYPNLEKEQILETVIGKKVLDNADNKKEIYEENISLLRKNLKKVLVEKASSMVMQKYKKKDMPIKNNEMENYYEENGVYLDTSIDLTKSSVQNKFNDSKINFTEKDEETFRKAYTESTVKSWIGKKEDVLKHRYMAILILNELERDNSEGNSGVKMKAAKNIFNSFKRKHPKIHEEFSKYTKEQMETLKKEESEFQHNKLEAKILDYCSKNVISKDLEYSDMDNKGKNEYLKVILLARELAERTKDFDKKEMLMKLANRGLEKINTDEKQFINFDKNGNYIINKETFMDEYYKSLSNKSMSRTDFNDLQKDIYNKHKRVYVYGKMMEYEKLEESEFEELETTTLEEQLLEINQIKDRKNRERIERLNDQKKEKESLESENKRLETRVQEPIGVEEVAIGEKKESNKINKSISKNQSLVVQDTSIFGKIRAGFNKLKEKISKYFINENMHEKKENSFYENNSNELNEKNNKKEYTNSNYDRTESWVVDGVSGKIDPNKINRDKSVKEIAENEREEEK